MKNLKNKHFTYPISLTLLATALLSVSWYLSAFFIFVAFLPLFELEDFLKPKTFTRTKFRFFLFLYLTFWLWNVVVAYWLSGIEFWGGVIVFFLNALLMTFPFLLYRSIKNTLGKTYGYFAFILFWLGFEYIHHHWFLAFPWLSLGNVFGHAVSLVQWYEYTGVLGGTLWALLINICVFIAWRDKDLVNRRAYWIYGFLFFLIPILISQYIWTSNSISKTKGIEVVVVQPNFHPTKEKLKTGKNFVKFKQQIKLVHKLAKQKLTQNTDLLLLPESALDDFFQRHTIINGSQTDVNHLSSIVDEYPKLSLLTGLTTFSYVNKKKTIPHTARYSKQYDFYYVVYNSAVFFRQKKKPQFYSKSKLVAGGEYMPLKWLIGNWSINAGGTSGEVTPQKERVTFETDKKVKYAPIVCYESVFGQYVSEYIDKGAEVLCVMTNDGFWDGTPEPRQHFNIDRLRCIEQRRYMARAAYTGISGFINHRGEVIKASKNQERKVLKAQVIPMTKKTFYKRNGDYLGRLAIFLAIALFLSGLVKRKVSK